MGGEGGGVKVGGEGCGVRCGGGGGWVGWGSRGEGGAWNTLCLPNSSRMKAESTPSSSSCVLGEAFTLSVSTMSSAQIHETPLIDNRGLAYAEHQAHELLENERVFDRQTS